MKAVLIDTISLASLPRLLRAARGAEAVRWFDPPSRFAARLFSIARSLHLVRADVRPVEANISFVRDEHGDLQYLTERVVARDLAVDFVRRTCADDPLVRTMTGRWSLDKILRHFDKAIHLDILNELLRVGMARWTADTLGGKEAACSLLIRKRPWMSLLKAEAARRGVELGTYGSLCGLAPLGRGIGRVFSIIGRTARSALAVLSRRLLRTPAVAATTAPSAEAAATPAADATPVPASSGPVIAINYGHRKIGFDSLERTEFFMFDEVDAPPGSLLVYNYLASQPLDAETHAELRRRGIRLVGHAPDAPAWHSSRGMYLTALCLQVRLVLAAIGGCLRLRPPSRFILNELLGLASRYAYWLDFYAAHRVRIDLETCHTGAAQVLALETLGGVSISYQYSPGVTVARSTHSVGEDVQFVFSEMFERVWRDEHAPVGRFVRNGFLYDGSLDLIRRRGRWRDIRKGLEDAGARFVICFFDENSTSRWDVLRSNDQEADDYEFLLRWLIDDPTLGLVFKPKMSRNLFERIGRISGLLDEARATGRCTFLTSGTIVGSVFPAEAGLAADLCMGKLFGAAAALEGRLAGVRAVLINEGFSQHPFTSWGRGRIIFDSWDDVRAAVDRFRANAAAFAEFGDWTPGIDQIDPFRDGQAGLRLGSFVVWLHEALARGASRQEALDEATDRLARRWGAQAVSLNSASAAGGAPATLVGGPAR